MGEGKYNCKPCSKDFYPEIRSDSQLSKGKWEHYCPECNKTLKWKPSDESVVNPCNQYALSKHSQEQIAIQFGKRYNIPSTVMRYSIVQGARQSLYNAYSGAMRIFALSLFFDKQPMVFEDGNQIRDFVNIKDVVSANLKVLEDDNANYQVFNVGGGKAWTVNDFYNKMQKITKKKIKPIISKYYRFGDTRHIFSDISKLEKLGWKPKFGVKDSIKEYWDYINTGKGMEHVLDYAQRKMKNLDVIRKV